MDNWWERLKLRAWSGLSEEATDAIPTILWIAVLAAFLFMSGCATGTAAIVHDGRALMCRTVELETTSWYLCRTHPVVTPAVLERAAELAGREGVSMPAAVGRVTGWRNYW